MSPFRIELYIIEIVRVTNQFFKFDFKFRALSDSRVDKRMRMRLHMKMTTAHAQFATLCRYDRFRNLRSGKL